MNQCMRVVPMVGRRMLSRTFIDRWPRSDFRAIVRDVARQMDRMEREFRALPLPSLLPRDFPRIMDHTTNPSEGGQYRVSVDVAGFKPEEIGISLDEGSRRLTVTAKCERTGQDGSRFAHEMSRIVTLPEKADLAQLKSTLHEDGILDIEAPFTAQEVRQIPINRTESIESPKTEQLESSRG